MKKALQIGWKDVLLIFRDRASLIMMLLAPFVLTIALGVVSGSIGSSEDEENDVGIDPITITIYNEDSGEIGTQLIDFLTSSDLANLVDATVVRDKAVATRWVDEELATAAVLIPENFTESVIPNQTEGNNTESVAINIYGNAGRAISVNIINAVVEQFITSVDTTIISTEVAIAQLISNGLITPQEAGAVATQLSTTATNNSSLITLNSTNATGEEANTDVNFLAIMAPGMAIFFLMYTVIVGGRSVLAEWEESTIPRLLTTPTTISQILAGKMIGTILSGLAQMLILIIACALLFGLNWGSPVAVFILILMAVFAATGWGMIVAALANNATQVATIGTALMLLFGILGGNFAPDLTFTGIMYIISRLTPNAWAMEGFTILANGGTINDITTIIVALLVMTLVLYTSSIVLFRRRWS